MTSESPGRRPHVCFVAPTIYPVLVDAGIPFAGGAEVQQTIIARELRKRGYLVSVLTGQFGVTDEVTPEGIAVHHTPPYAHRSFKGLRWIYPRLTDVVKRLREINPDVVYTRCAGGPLPAAVWYARQAGKRVIYAAASDMDFMPGRIFGLPRRDLFLYRASLSWCDAILVQNRTQQLQLRRRFGKEGIVVPNCYVEPDANDGSWDGPVIWVGTIKPLKRPELFLALAACFPQRRFVMIGGSAANDRGALEYARQIEAQAKQLSNLHFAGFVPFSMIGRHFDGAAALVNTSAAEGFPNTFLQSWIRGVPTLSFVAPASGDEPTGTIQCRDLDDMSRRLAGLLDDSAAWREAASRARRQFASFHGVDAAMSKYEKIFSFARWRTLKSAEFSKT